MQARTSEACHRGESRWKGIGVSNSEIHALPATARGKLLMTQVLALGGEKAARALLTLLGSPAPQLVGTQPCAGGSHRPRGTDTPGAWPSAESVDRCPLAGRQSWAPGALWAAGYVSSGDRKPEPGVGPCWAQSTPSPV